MMHCLCALLDGLSLSGSATKSWRISLTAYLSSRCWPMTASAVEAAAISGARLLGKSSAYDDLVSYVFPLDCRQLQLEKIQPTIENEFESPRHCNGMCSPESPA